MMWVSLQLSMARAAAVAADKAWNEHRHWCISCTRHSRHRTAKFPACAVGVGLMADRAQAHAELAHAQEVERQPIPGQLTLDDLEDR